MDFELSDEQREFKQAIRKFMQANASHERLRRVVDGKEPYDRRVWQAMARELGLQGLAVPERYGGSGAGPVELALALEEAGRALLCAPLLATAGMAAAALVYSDDDRAQSEWLPAIASGELVATLALAKGEEPCALESTRAVATRTSGSWQISGSKHYVLNGADADLVLVPARTGAGLSLFAVPAPGPGVERTPAPVLDPTRPMCELRLGNARATLIGAEGGATGFLSRTIAWSSVALAAEQLGGIQACLDMAVGYAKSRSQFGRPIGSFQAIKHKCADIYVDLETSRYAVYFTAWSLSGRPDDEEKLAEMTAAYVSEAFFRAAAQNLQIHGGIGYTWEHDSHLLFKRATVSKRLLRSPQRRYDAIVAGMDL
jgi:alkylation response protein AidB-like acyl-CoA dehydrogenase